MSRRIVRSRSGLLSGSVAPRKRSRKRSSSSSARRAWISSALNSRIWSAFIALRLLTRHELRLHTQLGGGEPERLLGDLLRHSLDLEQHAARLHHGHPEFRRTLALTHAGLGRLLRHRLVRENPDPDLAATLDVARHRHARGFDLARRDPARLLRLQAERAERHGGATAGEARRAALEHLAELDPLRC